MQAVDAILALSLCLVPVHQYLPERAYILVWSPDFCDCQVTWPAELTLMVLQNMYLCTFSYFKKPLPEGLASKQPESRG